MAVRFGIIGCSSVARRRFLPSLVKSTEARLERIGSRDAAKGADFGKQFGCAKVGSYEEVLTDPNVDAVYISTPGTVHEEWVRKAADHGKQVLCEKPAFGNLVKAREMVAYCKAKGVRLMEGYMFRYHPQHAVVQKLVREGRIGAVRFFKADFSVPNPPPGDIRHKRELGGGVFFDSAGYPAAAALLQVNSPAQSVYCQTHINPATGVDDAVAMQVTFAGGEMAQLTASYGLHYRSRYTLHGAKGHIEVTRAFAVNTDHRATIMVEADQGSETITLDVADQFQLMIDDFARHLEKRATTAGDFERELLHQHWFMDAAWRSNLEQRPAMLAEFQP